MSEVTRAVENEMPQASAAGNRDKGDTTEVRKETAALHIPGVSQTMLSDKDIDSVDSDEAMKDVRDIPIEDGKNKRLQLRPGL
ncbi:hypothetical protein Y032_0001g418 [Ancylostoma ceylanicum]|uniref:Uncharacterized protein n=1 Tax=Ancylostoma ceylanicum TaxID=53326 RepID=A0A016W5Z2_9BILA|nr:hypothetical protein Y032_0001g418 [Ancylostoma ceylanicum]